MNHPEKQLYGPLGELTREEWKRRLGSNQGLFTKIAHALPDVFPGPILNKNGDVRGDLGGEEVMYFTQHSTEEQDNFLAELLKCNLSAAHEYVLTVLGLKERWKRDIQWLQVALTYLKEEEEELHQGERLIQQGRSAHLLHFPEALKRHYPQLFKDVNFEGLTSAEALERIKATLQEVEPEEKYLEDYLRDTRKVFPFLFE